MHQLEIAGRQIRLHIPGDTESRLDKLAAAESSSVEVMDERLPYWAELWPSSVALADELLRGPAINPSAKVLEIGCGLGLAGIAASLRGGTVIMTDYLPEALEAARLNWEENTNSPSDIRRMDWRDPNPELRADLILAADVAYEERAFAPLSDVFHHLLLPQGKILLAEPQRRITRPFIRSLRTSNFHCETTTREALIGSRRTMIDIHELTRT